MNVPEVDRLLTQLAQLHAPDLRSILSAVFSMAEYRGERTITYANENGAALSLTYLASGKGRQPHGVVRELRREAALTDADAAKLRDLLAVVNGPQTDYLASFFHFSYRPVTRWWRYRDRFQILPPPPNAPLPPFLAGDWPFLIEATYTSPDQFGLKIRRQKQAVDELRLLLPVLLIGPIFQPNADRSTNHWVVPHVDPSAPRPEPVYAQEYYEVEGRNIGGPGPMPLT